MAWNYHIFMNAFLKRFNSNKKSYISHVVNKANMDNSNKLIIYSIDGKYSKILIDNAKQCHKIFPDWKIRVYAPIHIDKIL